MKKILTLSLSLLLSGCVQVPTSNLETPFGKFSFPKDMIIKKVKAVAKDGSTFEADLIQSRTNPEVIQETGDAQSKIVTATGDVVLKAFDAGKKAVVPVP